MSGRILVDTNVLIELLSGNETVAQTLNEFDIFVSCITSIELLSNPNHNKSEVAIINDLLSHFTVVDTINTTIQLSTSEYRRRKIIRKTPDAIIAATAKYLRVPLISFDTYFEKVKDVDVIILK